MNFYQKQAFIFDKCKHIVYIPHMYNLLARKVKIIDTNKSFPTLP